MEFIPDVEIYEKCGVFGAFGVEDAANVAMRGLVALNHRGQEGAGAATYDPSNGQFYFAGNGGLVRDVLTTDVLAGMRGDRAVGQTRYGTSGTLGNAHIQPIDIGGGYYAENGNQTDVSPLVRYANTHGLNYEGKNDSELKALIAGHIATSQRVSKAEAIERAYPMFTGAFGAVIMDAESLVAVRDRHGIRPLTLGRHQNGGWMVASETCALVAAGGRFVRDVRPGEMVVITKDGVQSKQLAEAQPATDAFEAIYFAREDSEMFGRDVFSMRYAMGQNLAADRPVEADLVVPVPNSAIPAALGYSQASGIPYLPAIHKSQYIHRTFIEPTDGLRKATRAMKLSAITGLIRGKRIAVLDDTIVRGNTQEGVVKLLWDADAAEVHVRIAAPPITHPDFYGINTPRQDELAYSKYGGLEGVRKKIGATSLGYQTIDGLVAAIGVPREELCLSAFTGEYPLDIGDRAKELIRV